MNPKRDQEIALMRDSHPPMWWGLYQGCLLVGFNEKQSMALVQTWVLSQNPYGIAPNNPNFHSRPNDEE